jgi:hypothetical protein
MTHAHYVPFDFLDDLHDGPPREPRTFTDHLLVIVRPLPRDFSLQDVYRNREVLEHLFPGNTEIDAAIRAGLQTLRDAGLIEFTDRRGHYRRRPTAASPRRAAA